MRKKTIICALLDETSEERKCRTLTKEGQKAESKFSCDKWHLTQVLKDGECLDKKDHEDSMSPKTKNPK